MFDIRSGVVGFVAAAALLSPGARGGSQPSGDVATGPGGRGAIVVSASNGEFRPGRLELPAGEDVEIEFWNHDSTTHDFTIDSIGLSTGPVEGGDVATARFLVPNGETKFVCSLHGGMSGVIVSISP